MRFTFPYIQCVAAAGLLVLAACAKPVTMAPAISAQEVEREKMAQMKSAHGAVEVNYKDKTYSDEKKKAYTQRLQKIVDKLSPEATKVCREMQGPEANCNMYIELSGEGKGVNAHADGKKIVVYPAMVDFAKNDNQLAFVIAHEYTHHMMGHVGSVQQNAVTGALLGTLADAFAATQGVSTRGQLGKMGAQASLLSYSPSFEREADYVGLYMLERAGFDITQVPAFWREMAKNNPEGIYTRTTHPTTPERYVGLRKAIEEIKAKRKHNKRLLPNMLPKDE